MTPQQVVRPKTVEEIQEVLRHTARSPSPVRAMGSCHSLTPCVATDGTIIDMKGMNRVIEINETNKTFTAQAGLQFVDASDALRELDPQFMTNIEIGNMTLGSAACCHTKDSDPELLRRFRTSDGLAGRIIVAIVYAMRTP